MSYKAPSKNDVLHFIRSVAYELIWYSSSLFPGRRALAKTAHRIFEAGLDFGVTVGTEYDSLRARFEYSLNNLKRDKRPCESNSLEDVCHSKRGNTAVVRDSSVYIPWSAVMPVEETLQSLEGKRKAFLEMFTNVH